MSERHRNSVYMVSEEVIASRGPLNLVKRIFRPVTDSSKLLPAISSQFKGGRSEPVSVKMAASSSMIRFSEVSFLYRLDPDTLHRLADFGVFDKHHNGRNWLISKHAIEKFLRLLSAKYSTVTELSEQTNLSKGYLRHLAREEKVVSAKIHGKWYIENESFAEFYKEYVR